MWFPIADFESRLLLEIRGNPDFLVEMPATGFEKHRERSQTISLFAKPLAAPKKYSEFGYFVIPWLFKTIF